MKNKILILLFLLLPLSVYGDTVYVDAIKNTLGPQGGTFLTTKVQSGNFYELEVTNNSAVFNTASNDNAIMQNVGVVYVQPPRKMTIATINAKDITCVVTEGNLSFFFVDDARLNTGGANIKITEVGDCNSINSNATNSASIVNSNLNIHIPSATFGSSNIWIDLEYNGTSGFDHLWKLKDYGSN